MRTSYLSFFFVINFLNFGFSLPVNEKDVKIISQYNENDGSGSYSYGFQTSDGTSRDETGVLTNTGDPDNLILVVRGSYSYQGPDGIIYSVSYVADENGFRPIGDHIPRLPVILEIITQPPLAAALGPPGNDEEINVNSDLLGSLLGVQVEKSDGLLGIRK